MTVQLDIQIVQGQRWVQLFEVADLPSSGYGQRLHIRDHHGATLARAVLTHDGDTNARVSLTVGGILANLGATISTGWDLQGKPTRRWVYSVEHYSLTDLDDVTVTHAGAAIIIANPTDENSVDEVAPFPSFNLFALRFDIEQVLTSEQKARVLAALGITGSGGGGASVHAELTGRDAADSHPLAAITGLVAALAGKEPSGSVATHDADTSAHGQTATGRAVLTAASTAAARTAIGLGNVDNTSDAGKPIGTATQTALDGKQSTSEKGSAGGYASLDSGGKVPQAQLPAIAITEYLGEVASQSAMLALSGQKGDWCIRTDTGAVWIITGTDPTLLGSWTSVSYPASPVTSVAGRTGDVTISAGDVSGLSTVATTGAYSDLTGKPTLGTAAALDVPASGNAANGEVVTGSDTRLTDARTPTSHTHPAANISDSTTAGRALITAADAAAQRTALGLGTAAVAATGDFEAAGAVATHAGAVDPHGDRAYADGLASNYATASQGALADSALQPSDIASGTITARADDIDLSGGSDGDVLTVQADGSLALETPAAGGGSPAGSNNELQRNNAGSFGAATGVTWASNQLLITAQAAGTCPFTVQGATSQSANYSEWKNSVGTNIIYMSESGANSILTVNQISFRDDPSNRKLTAALWQNNNAIEIRTTVSNAVIALAPGNLNKYKVVFVGDATLNCPTVYSNVGNPILIGTPNNDAVAGRQARDVYVRAASSNVNGESISGQSIVGASVRVLGGNGAANASGNANGGNVYLDSGQGFGTGVNGDVVVGETSGLLRLSVFTVSGLPSPTVAGRRAFVSDSNSTTFAAVVASGGSLTVPVYSDGTSWRIG